MRTAAAVLLLCAGCATQQPQPPVQSRPPETQPAMVRPATQPLPTQFVGKSEYVPRDGRSYSVEEHPFAFMGRLTSGDGSCDETTGFTFANVKTFGTDEHLCKYSVERGENRDAMLWTASCAVETDAGALIVVTMLMIDDAESVGREGTSYRVAHYGKQIFEAESETSLQQCRYGGGVFERAPIKAAD